MAKKQIIVTWSFNVYSENGVLKIIQRILIIGATFRLLRQFVYCILKLIKYF